VAISQIIALANECAEEGWDGNDAAPVPPCAVARADDADFTDGTQRRGDAELAGVIRAAEI
jgi:hypothetical protein